MPRDTRRETAVDRAVQRYSRALRDGTNPCRADRNPDAQAENYRRAQERQELRAGQVRKLLESRDVPRLHRIAYRACALQLDAIIRRHSGETLRLLATATLARWTARGLDPVVLKAIARQVYYLTAD